MSVVRQFVRWLLFEPMPAFVITAGGDAIMVCARCGERLRGNAGKYRGGLAHQRCADWRSKAAMRLRWATRYDVRYLWLPWASWPTLGTWTCG